MLPQPEGVKYEVRRPAKIAPLGPTAPSNVAPQTGSMGGNVRLKNPVSGSIVPMPPFDVDSAVPDWVKCTSETSPPSAPTYQSPVMSTAAAPMRGSTNPTSTAMSNHGARRAANTQRQPDRRTERAGDRLGSKPRPEHQRAIFPPLRC